MKNNFYLFFIAAEKQEFVSHTFGSEEPKFVLIYKKESAPNEEELDKMHSKYNLHLTDEEIEMKRKEKEEAEKRRLERLEYIEKMKSSPLPNKDLKRKKKEEKKNYDDSNLIVLNQKKRDRRTIEEIQLDMRKKKQEIEVNSDSTLPISQNQDSPNLIEENHNQPNLIDQQVQINDMHYIVSNNNPFHQMNKNNYPNILNSHNIDIHNNDDDHDHDDQQIHNLDFHYLPNNTNTHSNNNITQDDL